MTNSDHFRVLYADDNEDAREMVKVMLELENIEIIVVGTVEDAWQIARTEEFDLYLLDSRFPDGSGLDLCRQVRENTPRSLIVFYSANAYETDRQEGMEAGADIYLTKPYPGDLAKTILETILLSKKAFGGSSEKSFLQQTKACESEIITL